jgi:predicted RND superfamily exporter protein
VVLTSVILGAGMLVLTTSSFLLTVRFGALAALTLAVALLADLMLLPVLLAYAHHATGWSERRAPHGGQGELQSR